MNGAGSVGKDCVARRIRECMKQGVIKEFTDGWDYGKSAVAPWSSILAFFRERV